MPKHRPPREAGSVVATRDLDRLRAAVERRWRTEVDTFVRTVRLAPALAGTTEALRAHLRTPGKRVRPTLLLGAWRAFAPRGAAIPRGVLSIAIALELMHAFILVHDDIVDCAESRRGEPSLHRRLEKALDVAPAVAVSLALVMGDLAFNRAWLLLATAEVPGPKRRAVVELLARVFAETGAGELLETVNATRPIDAVDGGQILQTYHAKTTRYTIEAPLVLGAILGGAGESARRSLASAARPLGLAFQIENDAHEIARLVAGAAITDDLAAGVKTRAIRLLHERLGTADRASLGHILSSARNDAAARGELARLFQVHQVVEDLSAETASAFARVRRRILNAGFPRRAQAAIEAVLDFLHAHRHHSESAHPAVSAAAS